MLNISRIRIPLILLILLLGHFPALSKIIDVKDLFDTLKFMDAHEPYAIIEPSNVYFINKEAAIDYACQEVKHITSYKLEKSYIYQVYRLAETCEVNEKLGQCLLKYYDFQMDNFRNKLVYTRDDFYRSFPDEELLCFLIRYKPFGFREKLIRDLDYFYKKGFIQTKETVSFWKSLSYVFYRKASGEDYQKGFKTLGQTLYELEGGSINYILKSLNIKSTLIPFDKETLSASCHQEDYRNIIYYHGIKELPDSYLTIQEMFEDKNIFKKLFGPKSDQYTYSNDIIIDGNTALFWEHRGELLDYLMQVEFVNKNSVKIYTLLTIVY